MLGLYSYLENAFCTRSTKHLILAIAAMSKKQATSLFKPQGKSNALQTSDKSCRVIDTTLVGSF